MQSTLIHHLLREKKERKERLAFIVEGVKACFDVIRCHPLAILSLTLSSGYLQRENEEGRRTRAKLAAPQFVCPDAAFAKLSDVETPQGVLAVVRQPQWDETRVLAKARVLGIYGDRVRDPANVGAIIRTAAALNLTGVWLSHDSADHFSPKVVRAAAGAVLTLPIFRASDLRSFVNHQCAIYSALLPSPGAVPLQSIRSVPRRLLIAVGNEGEGLSDNVTNLSNVRFFIPLAKEVESLNVAATVAIVAFYLSELPAES
jgi:TrmH family RNA methyltransferase